MFCRNCGAEIYDDAVICVKCGCSVSGKNEIVSAPHSDSTMVTVIKVFLILGCISQGWLIIPLAWCIPITVKIFNCFKNNEPIGTGLKVCVLLFVNLIAGICLLCMKDEA